MGKARFDDEARVTRSRHEWPVWRALDDADASFSRWASGWPSGVDLIRIQLTTTRSPTLIAPGVSTIAVDPGARVWPAVAPRQPVMVGQRPEDVPMSAGRSPCASVVMTQRPSGTATRIRHASRRLRPHGQARRPRGTRRLDVDDHVMRNRRRVKSVLWPGISLSRASVAVVSTLERKPVEERADGDGRSEPVLREVR